MILFANGCSWTWGGGLNLEEPDQSELRNSSVWPHHLGKLINAEKVYNLSDGCGSNQRIVRTTLDWILSQPKENLAKTVAVIQWTELSRYEFYYPKDYTDRYENIHDRWAKCKVDCVINDHEHDRTNSKKYNNMRLSNYTEIEGMYRFVSELLAIENLFSQYNITYYFWSFDPNLTSYFPKPMYEFCRDNFNWLNTPDTWTDGEWKYDRVSNKDPHPSLLGHEQIAHMIASSIKLPK